MDCSEIMQESADYIEKNLKNDLSVEQLASRAGFSPFHYCRLFSLYNGMPVMEYVRRRRLAHAASELWAGKRIIDVALDYGFETHNGFAKAFRKVYGYSPNEYKKRVSTNRPPAPNPLAHVVDTGVSPLPSCRIEKREGFYIAGLILRTSHDLSHVGQLPALWSQFEMEDLDNKIYAMAMPKEHGEYNICFPVGKSLYRHVNGVKVESIEDVDSNLYVDWVPPALYGIFSPAPTFKDREEFAENIIRTWKYIYDQWLPYSEYEIDPNGLDYEFYDERSHYDGPYSMDICVPLIHKGKAWRVDMKK